MSISSRASSVMTSVIAAPVYELTGARLARARPSLSLERAHALLGADDAVDLDEDGRLGGVLRVLDGGRPGEREPRPVAGQDEAPVLVAQRAQRVANAGVDRERAVREPAGERLVVDRDARRRRHGSGRRAAPRRAGSGAWSARSVGRVAEPPAVAALALDLGDRAEREVQDLERDARRAAAGGPAPRRCGSPLRSRRAGCARCATFWWAWKIVSFAPGWAGTARRTVIRSAKNEPSSGRGRKWRQQPRTTP